MRRIAFLSIALISLACGVWAATRPRYGGTMHVAMQSAPTSLEIPTASSPTDYWNLSHLLSLIADSLVTIDPAGRARPGLAVVWQSDSTARHWQLTLQHGVKFHDGSPASPAAIAQILTTLHPDWNIRPGTSASDSLTIDTENSAPDLLAELALPRNLILKRNSDGNPIGTGPFRVTSFQPGRSLKVAANEESWSGRPFVDAIEIEFGKSLRDQAVSLELARVDIIEAPPQAAAASSRFTTTSLPVELMALVFSTNSKVQDGRLRQAIALSIDCKPIQSVLLKGAAEPTASLLPNWMTGYTAAFSTQPNVPRAKALLADSPPPALILSYDPRDPQSQLIAERIALNAREAGVTIAVSLSAAEDLRLVRIALPTPDPALALREAASQLALAPPILRSNSVEDLYQAEHTLLDDNKVIPLFHLPIASAAAPRLRNWQLDQLGRWNLADVWLEPSRTEASQLITPYPQASRLEARQQPSRPEAPR